MQPGKQERNKHELCIIAETELLRVGFVLFDVSSKGNSRYFKYPGYSCLLRVADHRGRKPRHSKKLGMEKIAARITFNGNEHDEPNTVWVAENKVTSMIACAIGMYFLKAEKHSEEEDYSEDPCPDCGEKMKLLWSGVKCSSEECGYWFCY